MTDATRPRMAKGTRLSAAALAAAMFALLAFAPFASAATDPLGSGKTKFYLKKGFERKLDNLDVKVERWGTGTVDGRQIALDATGGSFDPLTGRANIKAKNSDGFRLRVGSRTVPISEIEVNTRKNWVRAEIANAKMQLATLVNRTNGRGGFGATLLSRQVQLTGKAVRRINNRLGLTNGINAGRVMSNSYTNGQPAEATLIATGNATLNLSPAAAAKLAHVGTPPFPEGKSPVAVKLSPLAPTTQTGLTAMFPIGGAEGAGALAPAANAGTLRTSGGLQLVQNLETVSKKPGDVTTVSLGNIWVDMGTLQASVEVTIQNPVTPAANLGNVGRSSIADINLAGATLSRDSSARTITVQNASATLQEVTAATLNQVFIDGLEAASPAFKGQIKFAAGDPLGTFSFTAQAQ